MTIAYWPPISWQHWSLFPRVQLTISRYWFRYWLGAEQATSHVLNQWWLVHWRIYASLGLNELQLCCTFEYGWYSTEVIDIWPVFSCYREVCQRIISAKEYLCFFIFLIFTNSNILVNSNKKSTFVTQCSIWNIWDIHIWGIFGTYNLLFVAIFSTVDIFVSVVIRNASDNVITLLIIEKKFP